MATAAGATGRPLITPLRSAETAIRAAVVGIAAAAEMAVATDWTKHLSCGCVVRANNALQLTSGGSMRASRASLMRRLQLSAVLGGLQERA